MTSNIKEYIRESRSQEVDTQLEKTINHLEEEGYKIEFGKIGIHTTYALLSKEDGTEVVGYTFLKDMKYYRENVGKLKALQQAIARKNINK